MSAFKEAGAACELLFCESACQLGIRPVLQLFINQPIVWQFV